MPAQKHKLVIVGDGGVGPSRRILFQWLVPTLALRLSAFPVQANHVLQSSSVRTTLCRTTTQRTRAGLNLPDAHLRRCFSLRGLHSVLETVCICAVIF